MIYLTTCPFIITCRVLEKSEFTKICDVMSDGIKVFCIGFNKSGTTTLNALLNGQLGVKSAHKPKWTFWTVKRDDPRLQTHEAYTDGETPFITRLNENYPEAYFILNTRPLKSWLVSRHKAVERSRVALRWILSKFLPLGFVARFINRFILVNNEKAVLRWLKIRNSFHRFVINYFEGSSKFIILDIEDGDMSKQLAGFLGRERKVENVQANKDGEGSMTSRIIDSIGEKKSKVDSEKVISEILEKNGISQHAESLTFFEGDHFHLKRSASDQISRFIPFLRPIFNALFFYCCNWRGSVKSQFAKWLADRFIEFFRSEIDLRYYTSVDRIGSGSR